LPDADGKAAGSEFVTRFGLPTATALVAGSVSGTGVFALPSALAPYRPSSLVAFVLVTIGALALALVFGWLNKRVPALPAITLHADRLLILTDVPAVMAHFGTSLETALRHLDLDELARLQFPVGSMGPKIAACRQFVAATG
jgi:Amino acid kinase family